jgi:PIN domain nuclease of toxin-antitoxin system
MAPFMQQLPALLEEQGGGIAALTVEICLRASTMAWEHRDPFDRLLAATAQHHAVPVISADDAFDALPGLVRIW